MSDITTGLIHHWKFDGTLTDSVGSDDFVHSGTASYIAGQIGQGVVVDNGETLDAGNVADLNFGAGDSFTIAGWVCFSATPSANGGLFNKITGGVGWDLRINNPAGSAVLRVDIDDGVNASIWSYNTGGPIASDVWIHIAFTLDRGTDVGTLYLNGVAVDNTAVGDPALVGSLSNSESALVRTLTGADTNGDDLRVYSRALSGDDISALYVFRGSDFLQRLHYAVPGIGVGVVR